MTNGKDSWWQRMKSRRKVDTSNIRQLITLSVGGVTFVWLVVGLFPSWWNTDMATAGTLGDSFGAVNALFSALAFAGVILALFIQMEELREQRKVLTLQQEEMTKTTNMLETQAGHQLLTVYLDSISMMTRTYEQFEEMSKLPNPAAHVWYKLKRERLVDEAALLLEDIRPSVRGLPVSPPTPKDIVLRLDEVAQLLRQWEKAVPSIATWMPAQFRHALTVEDRFLSTFRDAAGDEIELVGAVLKVVTDLEKWLQTPREKVETAERFAKAADQVEAIVKSAMDEIQAAETSSTEAT